MVRMKSFPWQPGKLSLLYEEAQLPEDNRKSAGWILYGNIFGTLHGSICGGGTAALVGLAAILGAGDFEFGLLVAIPQIAALLQIPYSLLVSRSHRRKIWLLTLGVFSRALWMLFGFMPLLGRVPESRLPLITLILLLTLSSTCGSIINVVWFPWFSDLLPLPIRGRWLARRDRLINLLSLSFGLLVGWLLDVLGMPGRYIIVFLVGGLLGVMDMLCFGFVKEVWASDPPRIRLSVAIRHVTVNRPFMRFVLMWTVWCFTANMAGAYLTPYSMNLMHLSALQVTLFGTVAAATATFLMVPRWGTALDRFGSRNVMLLACIGTSLTPLVFLFSSPGNIWPMLLHNLIGAAFWCGCNLAANSLQLFASPDDERAMYIAFFSAVTCLVGTASGTLCGGWILEAFRAAGLFTGWFDRYKALITLSVILRFSLIWVLVPGLANETECTPKEMLRSFHWPKGLKIRRR